MSLDDDVHIALRPAAAGLAASAAVLGDIGRAEHALADLKQYPDLFFLPGDSTVGEAWVHAANGRMTAAIQALLEGAGAARDAGAASSEMTLLTEVVRLGAAARVVGRLTELAEVCDSLLAVPRVGFARAMAAGNADDLLEASRRLEEAGALLIAAEAAATAAQCLRGEGLSRQATKAAGLAERLARSCQGAITPGLSALQLHDPLTGREMEIATMAASGLATKDIALQLHLSPRTVDNHLYRIYNKVGFTSRRALAETLGHRHGGGLDPA
ncbi:helix-turn-helix transcriptional regulator [Streptomyces sp. NPDC019396]|uniref:helix-turn-helix transcriptional regulator n=1 Tax=Streptomyces sp. NPDC019396 TaxID=3154687 RepID=UPI00340311DB